MAAGDVKVTYAASSNLTVTNLNSLAASASLIAGWESAEIDNSTNRYTDIVVSGQLTIASANNQVGEVRIYVVPRLDDSNYPAPFDGTESTESITDTEERDAIGHLMKVLAVDASTGAVIAFAGLSVLQACGYMPEKFVLFITGNVATSTNAQFAASGNQITTKGRYFNVAAS